MSGLYGCLLCLCLYANYVKSNIIRYDSSVIQDANLDTAGLITKYGYKVETHKIDTKDGFRLLAHRIPKPKGQPVLLVHGLEDSSAIWVLTGPRSGLAYLLSDLGYDVWMLNTRGNRYSRYHRKYHKLTRQFWDFSFHEVGIYDLPAGIDYILAKSAGYRELHYVGHSQGTTAVFVMGAERPQYMKKVKLLQALAPVAYFDNLNVPLLNAAIPLSKILLPAFKLMGIVEFPPESDVWRRLLQQLCSYAFRNTCVEVFMEFMGIDNAQFNSTFLPVYFGHYPSGSSVKSIEHYIQLFENGGFTKYNYQYPGENERHYGSFQPPSYNVTNINCKVALYYGQNDYLSSSKDVRHLRNQLPNVVHDELLAYKQFNHLDFVAAIDAKKLLYDSMFQVMDRVNRGVL